MTSALYHFLRKTEVFYASFVYCLLFFLLHLYFSSTQKDNESLRLVEKRFPFTTTRRRKTRKIKKTFVKLEKLKSENLSLVLLWFQHTHISTPLNTDNTILLPVIVKKKSNFIGNSISIASH